MNHRAILAAVAAVVLTALLSGFLGGAGAARRSSGHGYAYVPPAAFIPGNEESEGAYSNSGRSLGLSCGRTSRSFTAPLQLPQSATIESMQMIYQTAIPAVTLDLELHRADLYSLANEGDVGWVDEMAEIRFETLVAGDAQAPSTSEISYATIDNGQYAYYLQLYYLCRQEPGGLDITDVLGVIIEYTYSGNLPILIDGAGKRDP